MPIPNHHCKALNDYTNDPLEYLQTSSEERKNSDSIVAALMHSFNPAVNEDDLESPNTLIVGHQTQHFYRFDDAILSCS